MDYEDIRSLSDCQADLKSHVLAATSDSSLTPRVSKNKIHPGSGAPDRPTLHLPSI